MPKLSSLCVHGHQLLYNIQYCSSASNNGTTTCGSRVNAVVGGRKRPPVQVTECRTTCASRVNALVPLMHVNNITDSNSDYHLFTLRAHVVLTLCYLCWWSFLPLTSAFTLLAHVVVPLLLALCGGGGGCMWRWYVDIYSGVWHSKAAGLALP